MPQVESKSDAATACVAAGDEAVAIAAYNGHEIGETGDVEVGYLSLVEGERIKVLTELVPGHCKNQFPDYVFGRRVHNEAEQGWIPAKCLKAASARDFASAGA